MLTEGVLYRSFSVVNRAFIFVIMYYLLELASNLVGIFKLHILLSALFFVTQCGVMAAISKIVEGNRIVLKLFTEGIKFFFIRYLGAYIIWAIVGLLYFIPYVIVLPLIKGKIFIEKTSFVIMSLYFLPLSILTIYVFPFVFVKGEGADAVIDGVKYLFKNFRRSTALILMEVAKTAISILIVEFSLRYPYKSWQYISLSSVNTFISTYIYLTIFTGACYILGEVETVEIGDVSKRDRL